MVARGHEYTILTSSFEKKRNYYVDFLGLDNIEEKDKEFEKKTGVKIERVSVKLFVSGRAIWNYKIFLQKIMWSDSRRKDCACMTLRRFCSAASHP